MFQEVLTLVVKNPVSDAGDTGSIPGQGTKILHARHRSTKPEHLNYWAYVPQRRLESLAHQSKIVHDATKIPCAATKMQCSQTNKYILKR